MEQVALVQKIFPDGTAEVIRLPEESCAGNCAICGGCREQEPFVVQNPVGAQCGDRVILAADPKVAKKTAAMLYTVPTALLIAGYLVGEQLWGRGALVGLGCGVAGMWLVLRLDRKMTKKHPITYVITGLYSEETA